MKITACRAVATINSRNLGNGAGYSVLEVLQSVERISGRPVPHVLSGRRQGDVASLVASAEPALKAGWQPRYAALDDIVRTAFLWRQAHPNGYGNQRQESD